MKTHRFLFLLSLVFLIVFLVSFFVFWSSGENWQGTSVKKGADLVQHFVAAQMVREGKMNLLYHDSNLLHRMQNEEEPRFNFNYVYSPLVAKIASWTIGNDYLKFYIRWLIASLIFLAISTLILRKLIFPEGVRLQESPDPILQSSTSTGSAPSWRLTPSYNFIIYVLGFPSVAYSLILGQNTFLSLLIICAAGALLNGGRMFSAGVILSCMFYKPQILVFLGFVFFVIRWFRFLWGLILGCAIWLTLTIFAGGWQNFLDWMQVLIGMGADGAQSQNWTLNITWLGFFQSFGIHINGFLWMAIASVPLALASIGLKFSNLKPSEILFASVAVILPFLPYALSYEILLTLPAFLMSLNFQYLFRISNSEFRIFFQDIIIGIWYLTALLSFQPWNSHWAIYAPFLTLVSLYAVVKCCKGSGKDSPLESISLITSFKTKDNS